MVLGLLFQGTDPFPDPEHAGQEIEFIGVLFASVLWLILLIYLMIYYTKDNREKMIPPITVLGFSYLTGFEILVQNFIALSPLCVIFFMVFQTGVFLQFGLDYYNNNQKGKKR